MTLIQAIEGKNACLQKFLSMTETLRDQLLNGDFSQLGTTHELRDAAIRAMDHYDQMTREGLAEIKNQNEGLEIGFGVENDVRHLLQERERILKQIQNYDAEIVSLIEKELSKTEAEILASQKGKEQISRFKSEWVGESGKELDSVL